MKHHDVQNANALAPEPERKHTLPRACWQETWSRRPDGDVVVGILLPSPIDETMARERGDKAMENLVDHTQRRDAYFDALVKAYVSWCITDGEDVNRPFIECPEDNLEKALKPSGILRLWEAIEDAILDDWTKTSIPEASDAEVIELAATVLPLDGIVAKVLELSKGVKKPEERVKDIAQAVRVLALAGKLGPPRAIPALSRGIARPTRRRILQVLEWVRQLDGDVERRAVNPTTSGVPMKVVARA